ncbi:hypothetical protein IGI39_002334 [Enterococcus sp. AZ135]
MKRKGIFIGCLLILLLIYSRQAAQNKLLQKEGATMDNAKITIAFPLRGEWYTETSPADRVPSHGTDRFGLRYAFDFIQKDRESSSHTGQTADYFLGGIPLEKYYCFGQPIYAPFAGEIIIVENNTNDGENASWIHDQTKAIRHSLFFNPERDGFEAIAGNYVVIKQSAGVYAAFCHLQKDSIAVTAGSSIQQGAYLGNVGHSGNSTEPHLHFQLMDSAIIESANGLPFVFEAYEKYNGQRWELINNHIPAIGERIRSLD